MNDTTSEKMENEWEMGPQPIGRIMDELTLKPHDLVAASEDQITHKMIAKACKGRRLTMRVRLKIQTAINKVTGKEYPLASLFNYR